MRGPLKRLTARMPRFWRVTVDWLVTIACAALVIVALEHWVITPYQIPSSSMEPTLNCAAPGPGCLGKFSDRVLACKVCYALSNPKRDDIVVFRPPKDAVKICGGDGVYVKRLIGLPGETIAERSGYVYINGHRLDEPYIEPQFRDQLNYGPTKIANGQYFMMGDNRAGSCDSRKWGTVPRSALIGKVVMTFWPPPRVAFR